MILGLLVVVAVTARASVETDQPDDDARCEAGDADACEAAARNAEKHKRVARARTLRERAAALRTAQQIRERAAKLGIVAQTPAAPEPTTEQKLAAYADELELARTVPLVEAVPNVESLTGTDTTKEEATPPAVRERPEPDDLRDDDRPTRGDIASRFGFILLAAGEGRMTSNPEMAGLRARLGAGLRFGLMQRRGLSGDVFPTVGVLAGITLGSTQPAFFTELRAELLVASTERLAQAGFTLYALGGLDIRGSALAGYVGAGLGWNWAPKGDNAGSGGGSGLGALGGFGRGLGGIGAEAAVILAAGAIAAAAIVAFVLAGRIEVRYFPATPMQPANQPPLRSLAAPQAPPVVAVLFGVGA